LGSTATASWAAPPTTKHRTRTRHPAPLTLPGSSGTVAQLAAGCEFSLALTSNGQLYAFGENIEGELGSTTNNGTTHANPTPALVTLPGENGTIVRVAAGCYYSLVLTSTGQLYAFGRNDFGQLGNAVNNGGEGANPTPTLVTLPGVSGTDRSGWRS
jgi:alpha-tubulin suppressor-like RCC1 family protein